MSSEPIASAQVVLRSASGAEPGDEPVTAATLSRFAPSPQAAAEVADAFRQSGFEVGTMVGNSFSITAPATTFERFFGVRLAQTERGGLQALGEHGGDLLPVDGLPEPIVRRVAAVTFVPPPAFGPTGYGP